MNPTESSDQVTGQEGDHAGPRDRQLAKDFLGWKFPTRPPDEPQTGTWHVEETPLHELSTQERAFVVSPGTPIPRFTRDPAAAMALALRAGDLKGVANTKLVAASSNRRWGFGFTMTTTGGSTQGRDRMVTFTWTDAARVLRHEVVQPLEERLEEKGKQRQGFGVETFPALIGVLKRVRAWLGYRKKRKFRLREEPYETWTAELESVEEKFYVKHRASTPGAAMAHVLSESLAGDVERLRERLQGLEERVEAGVMFEDGVPNLDLPGTVRPDDLRDWRSRQGLTQQAAADLVRVSRSSWQKWELDDNPRPGWLLLAIEGAMVRERRKGKE